MCRPARYVGDGGCRVPRYRRSPAPWSAGHALGSELPAGVHGARDGADGHELRGVVRLGLAGTSRQPRGARRVHVFDLRHSRGNLYAPIGQPPAPYGRLSELLGRVLMLRASRREDRKRVPRYSSSQLPHGSAGADVRESFGKCQCGAGQAPGGLLRPRLAVPEGPCFPSREVPNLGTSVSVRARHTRPRGSEESKRAGGLTGVQSVTRDRTTE